MSTPQAPAPQQQPGAPAPPPPAPSAPPGAPAPGAPAPPPGAPAQQQGEPPEGQGPGLESAYQRERTLRRELEAQIAQLRQQGMSDQERAVAAARAEGRAEAEAAGARLLAAAEFRHLAAGRIADPERALEMLDMSKLVKDGAPNTRAIKALVDQLAAVPPPPPPPGYVPAGPRQTGAAGEVNGGGDWLRAAAQHARGGR